MPKLRNAESDVEAFAQWIGRKCRNHHPLEELKIPTDKLELAKVRAGVVTSSRDTKKSNMYQATKKGDVSILEHARNTLVYDCGGRVFTVEINELEEGEIETVRSCKRIAVGY